MSRLTLALPLSLLLFAGCSETKPIEAFPGFTIAAASPAAVIRESDDVYVHSIDGHTHDLPKWRGWFLGPQVPVYRQFQVPAGTHTLSILLHENSSNSFHAALRSTERPLTVKLEAGHTYSFLSHSDGMKISLATVGDSAWAPELVDETAKKPVASAK